MAKWVPAGKLEELPDGQRKCVTADGAHLVLFRIAGQVHAVANVCPHAGMPINEGELTGSILVCPYHGYTFNVVNGKNVDYPDDTPLTKFPTRIEDGQVQIDVDGPANP